MKKDIEWLRKDFDRIFNHNIRINSDKEWDKGWNFGWYEARATVYALTIQLDEPEVLSQEWIDEHSETFKEIEESMVPLDKQYIKKNKVQEILVPKQELPVMPQFVAEHIENRRGESLAQAYNVPTVTKVGQWLLDKKNCEVFARAWLDGYTVEEEQKYVVELPNPNNQLGRHKNVFLNKKDGEVFIDSASLFVNDITKYGQFALTEEEIKKDFEWAWAFAKRVEELEE